MKKILICLILSFSLYIQVNAQLYPLPVKAQAVIFRKVFSYLKSFQKTDNVKILVVYNEYSEKDKDGIVAAFKNEKMNAFSCKAEHLSAYIKDATIIYLSQNVSGYNIKSLCRKNKKLSITGDPDLVSRGDASIGVGNSSRNEPGKKMLISPKIILNLSQLQNEAQEVTELLSLDSIIKVK